MINKKNKNIPTVEEFNNYKPIRLDFKWKINDKGLVSIIVPKFHSKIGITFCKLIKKENKFSANFDRLGSIVWNLCNGINSVKIILDNLKKKFPEEKNIDQRLYLFLQQMKNLNYIDF